ncbi:A disintegrin and metalloproteinase with thrombospondin motifs adt-1-like [Dreissena polymorpha]|uniref:A disintegrin and metalloproteinase with thrombospondin motifs adt-1-like n=1 Tax=Dreissena polymorpha TaxID=45954 RepID=UPI0022653B21|nr:A disintegrin and metalloproteinase with thrombospondin motifs adt-1-like [Dreissena polymorpha]
MSRDLGLLVFLTCCLVTLVTCDFACLCTYAVETEVHAAKDSASTLLDGRWTLWSQWSICSVTCGGGFYQRSRECSNPTPSPYGQQCIGQSMDVSVFQTQLCPQTDGGRTYWTVWSTCSAMCGGGSRQRYRECTNLPATNNGAPCHWSSVDIGVCNDNTCALQARLVSGRLGELFVMTASTSMQLVLPVGCSGILYDLVCQGYERTLLECRHSAVSQHTCGHSEDVGVSC